MTKGKSGTDHSGCSTKDVSSITVSLALMQYTESGVGSSKAATTTQPIATYPSGAHGNHIVEGGIVILCTVPLYLILWFYILDDMQISCTKYCTQLHANKQNSGLEPQILPGQNQ
jgi:hypothetical protein